MKSMRYDQLALVPSKDAKDDDGEKNYYVIQGLQDKANIDIAQSASGRWLCFKM